jgi:hypothetical protein
MSYLRGRSQTSGVMAESTHLTTEERNAAAVIRAADEFDDGWTDDAKRWARTAAIVARDVLVLATRLRDAGKAPSDLRRAGGRWALARGRTAACRDEFGWGPEGDEACAEYADHEDAAAQNLIDTLAYFASQPNEPTSAEESK